MPNSEPTDTCVVETGSPNLLAATTSGYQIGGKSLPVIEFGDPVADGLSHLPCID